MVLLDSVNHLAASARAVWPGAGGAHPALPAALRAARGSHEDPGPGGSEAELGESQVLRFEPPDARRRWDRPLFTAVGPEEPLPLAEIRAALFEDPAPRRTSPRSRSRWPRAASCTSWIRSSRVLAALMDAQRSAVPGDLLALPGATELLRFTRPVTMAELSRLSCQFMHPNKENLAQLANVFLQYLSQSLT